MSGVNTASSSTGQFIVVLLIFVGVLAVTYFVTRWISGYQKTRGMGTNIELIESAPLAPNKHIQIVRVGDKYVALAVSKDSVTLLTELGKDELILSDKEANKGSSFKDIMTKAKALSVEKENE